LPSAVDPGSEFSAPCGAAIVDSRLVPATRCSQQAKLFLIMLTAIGCAVCILAGIGILRIAKARRARSIDREMRDYVRRAY